MDACNVFTTEPLDVVNEQVIAAAQEVVASLAGLMEADALDAERRAQEQATAFEGDRNAMEAIRAGEARVLAADRAVEDAQIAAVRAREDFTLLLPENGDGPSVADRRDAEDEDLQRERGEEDERIRMRHACEDGAVCDRVKDPKRKIVAALVLRAYSERVHGTQAAIEALLRGAGAKSDEFLTPAARCLTTLLGRVARLWGEMQVRPPNDNYFLDMLADLLGPESQE
jgi:hypothetical protein